MRIAEDSYRGMVTESRESASQYYRKAAERLAKQIIATGRTAAGVSTAVSDLGNLQLNDLIKEVRVFPSTEQCDKWDMLPKQLHSGTHDDKIKASEDLTNARGNIRKFKKEYERKWASGLAQ